MRHFILVALLLSTGLPFLAEGGSSQQKQGLAAHYYKDPTEWGGNWTNDEGPSPNQVDPADWTFSSYQYTRVEPLVNHLFIRRGWFSVRWVGSIEVAPGHQTKDAPDVGPVTFELWMDDGARLSIDGQKLIDDWRPCPETSARSHRRATVTLSRGPHRIAIEYFQGQSLQKADHDPAKLYWSSAAFGIPRQIVPASHLSHTDADLEDRAPSQGAR